ncbi:MAG: hypothetical protein R2855_05760 [Thermomicrobiales bacterium]
MSEACRALETSLSAGVVSSMLTLAAERADHALNSFRIALNCGEDDLRFIPSKVNGPTSPPAGSPDPPERLSAADAVQPKNVKRLGN